MKLGALTAMMGLIGAPAAGMAARTTVNIRSLEAVKQKEDKPEVSVENKIGTGKERGYRSSGWDFGLNQK